MENRLIAIDIGVKNAISIYDGEFAYMSGSCNDIWEHGLNDRVHTILEYDLRIAKANLNGDEPSAELHRIKRDTLIKNTKKQIQTRYRKLVDSLDIREDTVVFENPSNMAALKSTQFSNVRKNALYRLWDGEQIILDLSNYLGTHNVIKYVDAFNTSNTCPLCFNSNILNRVSAQNKFSCTKCHFEEHPDIIGAMNIYALGYKERGDKHVSIRK